MRHAGIFVSGATLALFLTGGLGSGGQTELKVDLHGVGKFRIGMSLAEMKLTLRDPAAKLEGPDETPDLCGYVMSKAVPKGLSFMFQSGRLARIDIDSAAIRTLSGAGIGDAEERIKSLYSGKIRVEQHRYDQQGHYLIFSPIDRLDKGLGMVFETDGKTVTAFRVGKETAIALVEGCL